MSAGTRLALCNLWPVKTRCRKKLVANGICSRVKRHGTGMYAQCRCERVEQARRDEGRRAPSATTRHQRPRAISDEPRRVSGSVIRSSHARNVTNETELTMASALSLMFHCLSIDGYGYYTCCARAMRVWGRYGKLRFIGAVGRGLDVRGRGSWSCQAGRRQIQAVATQTECSIILDTNGNTHA